MLYLHNRDQYVLRTYRIYSVQTLVGAGSVAFMAGGIRFYKKNLTQILIINQFINLSKNSSIQRIF